MTITIQIPRTNSDPLVVRLNQGEVVFFVGANGSGKSSLVYQLSQSTSVKVKRISAHRQNWLTSSASNLSAEQRQTQERNIRNSEQQVHSRWKEDFAGYKPNISIFDLVDAENVRARKIATAVDKEDMNLAKELAEMTAPIGLINEILFESNFNVAIGIQESGELFAQNRQGAKYGIAEMSDGERNALLIAADVLTSPADSLLIIDEPERHLHYSIVEPLLKALFRLKTDCCFLISTHSVGLLDRRPGATRVLVRSCVFTGQRAVSWDVDQLADDEDVDDDLRRAILGSRRKILFVEGERASLDVQLYAILFPLVTVVPVGSCTEVERCVKGIRNSEALHWATAFGIIDRDGRPDEEIASLKLQGIFALPVHSVESIYYNLALQRAVAEESGRLRGDDVGQLLESSKSMLIQNISQHIVRLAAQVTTRRVRRLVEEARPTVRSVLDGRTIELSVDVPSIAAEEETLLRNLLAELNHNAIIGKYPIRETGAVNSMAKSLGFQNASQYQRAARVHMRSDEASLRFVRGLFDGLYEAVGDVP